MKTRYCVDAHHDAIFKKGADGEMVFVRLEGPEQRREAATAERSKDFRKTARFNGIVMRKGLKLVLYDNAERLGLELGGVRTIIAMLEVSERAVREGHDRVYPGRKWLSDKAGVSTRTMSKILARLVEMGWIKAVAYEKGGRAFGRGCGLATEYAVVCPLLILDDLTRRGIRVPHRLQKMIRDADKWMCTKIEQTAVEKPQPGTFETYNNVEHTNMGRPGLKPGGLAARALQVLKDRTAANQLRGEAAYKGLAWLAPEHREEIGWATRGRRSIMEGERREDEAALGMGGERSRSRYVSAAG